MQKNKKAKKSTLRKIAPFVIGAAAGAGLTLGYLAPADFNQDGVYSQRDIGASIVGTASFGVLGGCIDAIYTRHHESKNRSKVDNKADSYGHVKAV